MRFYQSINNEGNPLGLQPEFFVYHHTGSSAPDENQKRFLNRDDYISVHFELYRSGRIVQLMDLDRIAFHAGVSSWKGFEKRNHKCINPKTGEVYYISGMNPVSHGVEINSDGVSFTKNQIKKGIHLGAWWCIKYNKPVQRLIRHEDIAPGRKIDVGGNFFKPQFGSWEGFQSAVQDRIDIIKNHYDSIREIKKISYYKKNNS